MVTNSFCNRNFMQHMRRLSMHSRGLSIHLLGFWGGERDFLFFVFSQCVLIRFPQQSQWHLNFIPFCCGRFLSYSTTTISNLIQLKKTNLHMAIQQHIWVYSLPPQSNCTLAPLSHPCPPSTSSIMWHSATYQL
jgi:hypothetical protein